MELVDICKEAGVPDGVVNLLSGDLHILQTTYYLQILLKRFQSLVQQG